MHSRWLFSGVAVVFVLAAVQAQQGGVPVNRDDHTPGNLDQPSQSELLDGAEPTVAEVPRTLAVAGAAQPVYTHSYDNLRSSANTQEARLTPANARMRLLATVVLGGDTRGMESQPLIAPRVLTVDGAVHDLLVVSTMGNQVAAFDANDGTPIWLTRLGTPVTGSRNIDAWLINDHWGVLSTGVIKGIYWYGVAWVSPDGTPASGRYKLFQVHLRDGRIVHAPEIVPANANMQRKQRGALTLVGDTLFIPWGTIQETAVGAHGYVTAFDIATQRVVTELNLTPTGKGGGVWMAGQGLIADTEGYLYAMTGNGAYDGVKNFGESFVKLRYANSTLTVIDHYAPFKDADRALHYEDMDLGAGGPALIPELGLLFGAGKDGILYQLPWRRLKQPTLPAQWFTFYPGPGIPAVPQDKLFFAQTHHMHGSPVTWKTASGEWRMFNWGENGNLRAWRVDTQGVHFLANGTDVSSVRSPTPPGGMPGGFLTLSANGGRDGVLWATVPFGDANRSITQGYVAAYDAGTFGKYADGSGQINKLWQSDPFVFNKFNPPVVSGGKLYVATYDAKVLIFGP